jgi:uncharacterized membrane protein YccC
MARLRPAHWLRGTVDPRAWLFFSVTSSLVLLMSLVGPLDAFSFAANRTIEVVIGTAVAIVAAIALAQDGSADSAPRRAAGPIQPLPFEVV